ELGDADLVRIRSDAAPLAIRAVHEVEVVSSIAVLNSCQNPFPVVARLQLNFGYPGEVLPCLVAVRCLGSAEPVEIDLLIEIEIDWRPLACSRVASIKESGVVPIPCHRAARRPSVHAQDGVGAELTTRCHFKNVHVPGFATEPR